MTDNAELIRFLEFLQSLAPEGETPLIVRQKPILRDGEIQLHADGAVKCTWPASLPDLKRIKPGQAWYGNTASFIVDRFEDGRISAASANCEYCLALVLDDVGTKSKEPPLAPTWKMETSPGNFQWGYAFTEDQPTKAEFTAAVRAIAEAGYTDPGATNAVRNFRLPGSINLKPGRENFAARLVAFHPERMFSLPDICTALGVTPGEPVSSVRPIRVQDTGTDDVFAWLNEQGLVLAKPNPEGWAGVICPNSAEHTDGNPEGRYHPATRSYCCLHSHCVEFGTAPFLAWVAAQGGPAHSGGIRDDLMASVMTDALQKLEPTTFFTDDAKAIIEEVERKEVGRIEKADWYRRFAYIQADDSYFDLDTRRELSRSAFNATFRHVSCKSIHNGRRIEASVCFDENRQAMGARALAGLTYAAGDGVLVSRDGEVYANRWRDARPAPGSGDVSRWLEHCERLIPDAVERAHVLDVMAFKVQNPSIKINHAVLHGGDQGCGKDTLWAPLLWAVCGPNLRNRGMLDNDTLSSQWGYQLEAEIIILNELKETEAAQRRALANRLKPIIAAPPETISINRKNLHPYDMVNRGFVLAFSNELVPISLDSQDRRWFCIWSSAPRMTSEEGREFWTWYKTGGFTAIAGWLYARDVTRFNPAAPPAWTEWKHSLIEHGMSMAESYLVDMIRSRRGEFARGAVGSPFYALCDRLAGGAPSGVKVPQAALLHALKEAGWVDMGRIGSADLPTKKSIWAAPDVAAQHSKSELRRMVEDVGAGAAGPRLTSVK